MKIKLSHLFVSILFFSYLFSFTSYASQDPFADFESFENTSAKFNFNGSLEFRGLYSPENNQNSGGYNNYELKTNLNFRYRTADFYIQADINVFNDIDNESKYLDSYSHDKESDFSRNGTFSSINSEISPREFYINYEKGSIRLRAGNQLYHWGTADVINPASYFNPYDLRKFIFNSKDNELNISVFSFSAEVFSGSDSLELVLVPFHTPSRMPFSQSFWGINYREGPFPVILDKETKLDHDISGSAAGIRYYKNINGFDTHLSLFRGPDKTPYFLPEKTESQPGKPVSIVVKPETKPLSMAGIAVSNTMGRFIFQCEAVYSPDKPGVVDKNINSSPIETILPFETKRSDFFSFSAGFNYFLPFSPSKEGIFTFEWNKSEFVDKTLMKPFFSDVFYIQISEKFLHNKLEASVSAVLNRADSFYAGAPLIKYKISDTVNTELTYTFIKSKNNEVFSGYNKNDFFEWRLCYEF